MLRLLGSRRKLANSIVEESVREALSRMPAGSGGSTAWSSITGTPTTLSGYGITDAQPLDADLTSIAGLGYTANAILRKTAANTWDLVTTDRIPLFASAITGTPSSSTFLRGDGAWVANASGDVVGPASSTNNAVAVFDGTTGRLLKNTSVIIDASGNVSGIGTLTTAGTASLAQSATGNAFLNVGSGTQTGGAFLIAQAPAGQYAQVVWRSGTTQRWVAYRDNTAESGADAGSEWSLAAHTDAGVFIDNVIRITRVAGGALTLNRPVTIAAGTASPGLRVTTTGAETARFAYDGSNYGTIAVSSTGQVTFNAVGTGAAFSFSDRATISVAASANYSADIASLASSGTSSALALRGTATNATTTGTISNVTAVTAVASSTGVGATTTNASAYRAEVTRSNGTIVDGHGLYINTITGAMTNAYGIRRLNIPGGTATNFAIYTGTGLVRLGDTVNIATTNGLQVNGTKVVGAQEATISDPTGGTVQDSEARTAINTIIDRLQAHGLIA